MPAYRVQWEQRAAVTATVTVDLDELASWAVGTDDLRGIRGIPDYAEVRRLLELNPHFREELLRRWAAAQLTQT